jgi:3-dehydroshikimate dehydratase
VERNEFLDNGDGLELTRGAAFNLVADNVFRSTAANPEPSQGIEVLRGNDNVIARNRFEGYSDGIQVNAGDRNYIVADTFTDNTLGLSITGIDNVVSGNTITGNAVGVAVRPASPSTRVRITQNSISGNGRPIARCQAGGSCDPHLRRGGIVLGVPGNEHAEYVGSHGGGVTPAAGSLLYICPDHAPDCQGTPNEGVKPPRLTTARATTRGLVISGQFTGAPAGRYTIELFGNSQLRGAEGEVFLASTVVETDAHGSATFSVRSDRAAAASAAVTATATTADGATSEFSAPLAAH